MIKEKTITFYLPEEFKKTIKSSAHLREQNISEFIREAIAHYINFDMNKLKKGS